MDLPLSNRFSGFEEAVDDEDSEEEKSEEEENTEEADVISSKEKGMANTKEETNKYKVNVVNLSPASLMKIKLKCRDNDLDALVDTGASCNIMKQSVAEKMGLELRPEELIRISGLGTKVIGTVGKVYVGFSFGSVQVKKSPFSVVEDYVIATDVILGRKFCEENNIIINMANNKISKVYKDSSRVDIYIEDGKITETIYENVPMISTEKTILETDIVPVKFMVNLIGNMEDKTEDFYYEGRCSSNKIKGLDGVIDKTQKTVWITTRKGENRKGLVIRPGTVIGRVSTLVETNEDQKEDNEEWTEDRLKAEIPLEHQLSEGEKEQVYKMLTEMNRSLSKNGSDIGLLNVTPQTIELTDETPIWQKPRIFSEPINAEVDRQCDELESQDIIERSDSPWSSPIVPVRKGDGSLRMCVDYRRVNRVTKTQNFPIPNLSETIYTPHNINYFTKIDLTKGYYQVPISEKSRPYTAFSTLSGQYQFKRLSFGLKNSGIQF